MNILYIHQYFITPDKPGATRSYWISKELIANGHKVTMLTTSHNIESLIEKTSVDGIHVIKLKVSYSKKMSLFRRLWSFIRFMVFSTWAAFRVKNIDLVIATSTPLTIGFPALVLKKTKNIPFIFEVRDLWPEVPIQMGALKNKVVISLAKWFEKTIYKNALHIVALSPGMEEGVLATGMDREKVSMISNMAKIDKFWPREASQKWMNTLHLKKDTFKIIYFGSLGISNAVDYILDTAKLLIKDKSIEFLFLGYGIMVDRIKERIIYDSLENTRFLGQYNMEDTSEIVNLCDISLITFENIPILATNSPNKLFDSLSAGKPIIVNSPGWTKVIAEKEQCGIYVDPINPKDFATKITKLKDQPEVLKTMGLNARRLAETKYDKSILCQEFVTVVNNLNLD